MRVLVAGATGALGRPLVRQLVERGHEVWGTTRSDARRVLVEELGARSLVMDLLDAASVRSAVSDARPEAVVHAATAIPRRLDTRRIAEHFAETGRLRTEGTRNLIAAAPGVRLVAQSIAFASRTDGIATEDDPIDAMLPSPMRDVFAPAAELERLVLAADGTVLRYGFLYGPGTGFDPDGGETAAAVRARKFPIGGSGSGVWSFVHVEDAARATVLALERGARGAFNVIDDEPAPVRVWLPVYAEAIGAPPPRRVPAIAVRILGGPYAIHSMLHLRGASNAKAKRELGWEPARPTWRNGFRNR